MAWKQYSRYRPEMVDGTPITEEWFDQWSEARDELLSRGLAGSVYGIFVMHPAVTIVREYFYA